MAANLVHLAVCTQFADDVLPLDWLGRACVGGSSAYKPKCPVCEEIYPYTVLPGIQLEQSYVLVTETSQYSIPVDDVVGIRVCPVN